MKATSATAIPQILQGMSACGAQIRHPWRGKGCGKGCTRPKSHVYKKLMGKSPLFIGELTICYSWTNTVDAIFHSFLYVYQRVVE